MPGVIGDAALLSAFSHLEPHPSAVLAVSGGPDSMALMHLASRWLRLAGRATAAIKVVTVDHGLRRESAEEAAFVAVRAKLLGFTHATLTWTGERPKTGLQSAARSARYSMMTAYCRTHSMACLVTAHTEDDQAETFLMRLRRGSGVDGLAAMAAVSGRDDIPIVRPLLGMSKARLMAYLRVHAIPFVHDPSNDDKAFERVRLRHAMKACASAGITRSSIAKAASRLGRGREALSLIAGDFLERQFRVTPLGCGEIGLVALSAVPGEIALRALSQVLVLVSGRQEAPRLSSLERLLQKLAAERLAETLGGCLIIARRGRLYFYREPGRMKPAPVAPEPGGTVLWDGRFLLIGPEVDETASVRQLGAKGWIAYRKAMKERHSPIEANRLAALTTPALWKGSELVSAPALGFSSHSLTQPASVRLAPGLARYLNGI